MKNTHVVYGLCLNVMKKKIGKLWTFISQFWRGKKVGQLFGQFGYVQLTVLFWTENSPPPPSPPQTYTQNFHHGLLLKISVIKQVVEVNISPPHWLRRDPLAQYFSKKSLLKNWPGPQNFTARFIAEIFSNKTWGKILGSRSIFLNQISWFPSGMLMKKFHLDSKKGPKKQKFVVWLHTGTKKCNAEEKKLYYIFYMKTTLN